ncbi:MULTISPECIES: NADP-dependent malic enzyme [Limibacillus]|jgi:malate dehydrogenase (oxaloacetate-decarboxylating)(NADP+)|uniref:Malate dehydrogenase (Oxaloacetate-decarboxylating)(NADP+) n=1 Tax=Limibacillus halophilus TaxID=1579333 RepID=A0A839SNQ7_9PROT|nr:NADP-dependent malic enzyme [Limibacillus halophilus]MBB3064082.1 malate dehydrogenase (oxaloacetate-decarboxylating)(NADP+) [Limibacillus halophilus]
MSEEKSKTLYEDAIRFHAQGRPGKLEITASKPLTTQRELSLAYSPGVAAPCLKIQEDPGSAYDLTAKGNLVAVVSNGTAVLGLGDLGALASKPVMEGKAVLFKRFADIDAIDLCVDTRDVDELINCVRFLGPSFGGINLEDIKAPECFIIEERLKELLDIPVFHDDQHGTAIIAAAGLINALHLTDRDIKTTKMVINGAGSAGIACAEIVKAMGIPANNVLLCDTRGVIYHGRQEGMNQWKSAHSAESDRRSLAEALEGADVFFGVSAKGAVTQDMIRSMADQPIIFPMANPDPEILPEEILAVREDAIIATGRSDYPNQINNVLGFPYIFRGALDVRARTINMEMKIAAAEALAALAREDVPDEVDAAYSGRRLRYGRDYIIPTPFDPRLIVAIPRAVAQAAIKTGVAGKPPKHMRDYERQLTARLDPTAAALQKIFDQVRDYPQRVCFAEGEEERVIRAAIAFQQAGYGHPVLIGREHRIRETMKSIGVSAEHLEIHNARLSENNERYTDYLYGRHQREGLLYRDCQRMVNQDRNVFGACMLANGEVDALVTGLTRSFGISFQDVQKALDPKPGNIVFGLSIVVQRGRTVFIGDTSVHELPEPQELADIAIQSAHQARLLGHEPRVAFLSFSNFGQPMREKAKRIRDTVALLDAKRVDFEYDGEMQADVALDYQLMRDLYPFCRLSGPANILIMPALHSANISAKLLSRLGGGSVIGPLLIGMSKPVQIVPMGSTVHDLVTAAALVAHDALQADSRLPGV